MCLGLALLVGDSSCLCGDSATISAWLSDASVLDSFDSSLLDIGRGIDRRLSVLTWGLPLQQLRAVHYRLWVTWVSACMMQSMWCCPESWGCCQTL